MQETIPVAGMSTLSLNPVDTVLTSRYCADMTDAAIDPICMHETATMSATSINLYPASVDRDHLLTTTCEPAIPSWN